MIINSYFKIHRSDFMFGIIKCRINCMLKSGDITEDNSQKLRDRIQDHFDNRFPTRIHLKRYIYGDSVKWFKNGILNLELQENDNSISTTRPGWTSGQSDVWPYRVGITDGWTSCRGKPMLGRTARTNRCPPLDQVLCLYKQIFIKLIHMVISTVEHS